MRILTTTFNLLTYFGCWRPMSCCAINKKLAYDLFTIFMASSVYYVTLSQLMGIIMNVKDMDDFSGIFYLFLAMFESGCKYFCVLVNRTNIILLINLLTEKPCKPMDDEETKIQINSNKMARSVMFLHLTLIDLSLAYNIIAPITSDLRNKKLCYGAWVPFDYSPNTVYYIVYAHEIFSLIVASHIHIAVDALFFGLLLHLYCQMAILECRLRKITEQRADMLKICVGHHDLIYQIAAMLSDAFKIVILSQFSVSTITICFSLYQLTNVPMFSIPFVQMTVYICCIFFQIFFYCWFGNEVRIKSRELGDKIFAMNWTSLRTDDKRTLLMIMKRAMVPVEISSAKIINLTLDSFVNILKTSYSVYNVLQQSK